MTRARSLAVVLSISFVAGALAGVSCGGSSNSGLGVDLDASAGPGGPGGGNGNGNAGATGNGKGGKGNGGGADGTGDPGAAGNGGPGSAGNGGPGTAGSGGPGTAGASGKGSAVSCAPGASQCNDGKDNDGDGLVDALDPECSGPCDNDEGTFATGISGDNMDDERSCHQDCFFDGNSGQGDDGCDWDIRCDPENKRPGKCAYKASNTCGSAAQQTQHCIDYCRSRTPNGCDCFGCCAVPGQPFSVKLTSTCSAASFGDPEKCPRCTQNPTCVNTCEKCEVCMGKPLPDPSCPSMPGGQPYPMPPAGSDAGVSYPPLPPLPDGGTPPDAPGMMPPPAPYCDPGKISCGPGGTVPFDGCPGGDYCQTGCCTRYVE
jgi:hypothetical protein